MSPPFITFPQLNFIIKKKEDSNLLTVNELPSLASVFNALPTHGGQVESAFYSSNGLLTLSTSNATAATALQSQTGTECRIFKSTDYGNTWQTAINMTGTWGSINMHGAISPPSGKIVDSTDPSRINEKSISNLIYIESNPDVVYFTTRYNSFTSTDNGANIYKSFDGGANFALVGNWQTTEPTHQFESLHEGDVQPAPITGNPSVPIPKPLQGNQFLILGSGEDAGEAHKNVITLDVSQNYSAPTIFSKYKSPSSPSNYTQNLNTIIIPNGSISSIRDTSVSPSKYQIHTSFNSSHSLYPNFNTVSNLTTNNSQNFKFCALTSNGSDIIAIPQYLLTTNKIPLYSTDYGLSWSNFHSLPSGVIVCMGVCRKDIEFFNTTGNSMGFFPVIFALVMLSTGDAAILYHPYDLSSSLTWWSTLHTFPAGEVFNKIIPITDSSDDVDFFVAGYKPVSSPTNSTGQEPLLYRVNKPKFQ